MLLDHFISYQDRTRFDRFVRHQMQVDGPAFKPETPEQGHVFHAYQQGVNEQRNFVHDALPKQVGVQLPTAVCEDDAAAIPVVHHLERFAVVDAVLPGDHIVVVTGLQELHILGRRAVRPRRSTLATSGLSFPTGIWSANG
jgi:hypothetical protein